VNRMENSIKQILVVGSGAMGRQIGMSAAVAGFATKVYDISAESVKAAEQDMRKWLDGRISKGRLTAGEAEDAWESLEFTTELEPAAANAELVIEAATEKLEIKKSIFAQLDGLTPKHAILATNSSTLGSSYVAGSTSRPEQVCNMHFFNPALVMKAVEIVRHERTSDRTVEIVSQVVRDMGKSPILLNKEIPGFVANRLMGAVRDEALALLAGEEASLEDIDTAAKDALGYPMGPFELMDLVGLDVSYLIRQAAYEQTGDNADLPHPLLTQKYEAGEFGRKTGKGWYDYE